MNRTAPAKATGGAARAAAATRALDRLVRLIPPPAHPCDTGPVGRRAAVEEALGTPLPAEWYRVCRTYGEGSFGTPGNTSLLYLWNPFHKGFLNGVRKWSGANRVYKEWTNERLGGRKGARAFPYDVYPARPGLLVCGGGERRGLFWLTDGPPDRWPVIVRDPGDKFHRFDLPLAEFLFRLFSGKTGCWAGGYDAAWFRAHRASLAFRPNCPPPRRRKRKAVRAKPRAEP